MIAEEEIVKYYKEKYHNGKKSTGININKQLWIDYQEFCLGLSRKSKLKITASGRIRLLMIKDMMENSKKR